MVFPENCLSLVPAVVMNASAMWLFRLEKTDQSNRFARECTPITYDTFRDNGIITLGPTPAENHIRTD
jgi:hypothetical protein